MTINKKFSFLILIISAAIFIISCKQEIIPLFNSPLENDIPQLRTVELEYTKAADLISSAQFASMFGVSGNGLFFFDNGNIVKYDILLDKWTFNNKMGDPAYRRRVGEIIPNSDSLIIFASPRQEDDYPNSYKYISINSNTLEEKVLPNTLPFNNGIYSMTHVAFQNKALLFLSTTFQIYELNLDNLTGRYIVLDKMPIHWNMFAERYKYYAYIYSAKSPNIIKLNLYDYTLEQIPVPSYVLSREENSIQCGMVNGLFCIWSHASDITFCYDVENDEWCNGGNNFFKDHDPNNVISFTTDDAVYFKEWYAAY